MGVKYAILKTSQESLVNYIEDSIQKNVKNNITIDNVKFLCALNAVSVSVIVITPT